MSICPSCQSPFCHLFVPYHVRKIATLSHFNRVCKLSFLQASTPLQSHADLGIDPLNCRVCGRHFNQEASRVRHEQDSHQIRSQSRRSSVVRNILGGRGGSDSDSSIGDSSPLATALPSPQQQTLSPVPASPVSLSPISSAPLSPVTPQSPPPPLSRSPSPVSSASSASASSGDGSYTCNVCLCTFPSNRYYQLHLMQCR